MFPHVSRGRPACTNSSSGFATKGEGRREVAQPLAVFEGGEEAREPGGIS